MVFTSRHRDGGEIINNIQVYLREAQLMFNEQFKNTMYIGSVPYITIANKKHIIIASDVHVIVGLDSLFSLTQGFVISRQF